MKTLTRVFAAIAIVATAGPAHADEPVPTTQAPPPEPVVPPVVPPVEPPPPPVVVAPPAPVVEPPPANGKPAPGVPTPTELKNEEKTQRSTESPFRIYGAVSAAVTQPAFDWQLGGRLRISDRFMVGLDAEVDGLIGVQTPKFRTGILDIYATGIFRYPLRFEQINLRTTLQLGVSTMLIDLYGAPRGTTGIYVGLVPLGIEWKLTDHLFAIFDILGFALPAPQLSGAPFGYPQYRTAAGLEVAF